MSIGLCLGLTEPALIRGCLCLGSLLCRERDDSQMSKATREARLRILRSLHEVLSVDFQNIKLDYSPEHRYRLLIPWDGNDYFLFDFSTKVKDAFRCAFVVDLDQESSERRRSFQEILGDFPEEVADILGSPVVGRTSDANLAKEGLRSWTKISTHRHCMHRLPELDWNDTEAAVESIAPHTYRFVEGMNSLLQRYRP